MMFQLNNITSRQRR